MKVSPAGIMVVTLGLAACSGGGGGSNGGEGFLSLAVTDAPVHDVAEVWVQFSGVEVKPQQGSPVEITFESPVQVDLKALTGENSESLLNGEALPAGQYNWIRLQVDAEADGIFDSYAMTDTGEMVELEVPGSRGLQLSSGFSIVAGATSSFIIDWDLNQALVAPQGRNSWILRPSLRITDQNEYGTVAGTVTEALLTAPGCENDLAEDLGNEVYLFEGVGAELDDIDGDDGDPLTTAAIEQAENGEYGYRIAYVSPGNYTVALTCQGLADAPDSDDSIEFTATADIEVTVDQEAIADF